jgi:energy-coupling factor transporter ATP-binding protein EcfA2
MPTLYKGQGREIMEEWCHHYPSLMTFANFIKRLQNDKKDLVIALCGREGEGKSTLALILAFLIDNKFDLVDKISYIPSEHEIYNRYNKILKEKSCYIIDEAIRSLYKLKFQSKEQQGLAQIFATERYKCICTFLCIPRFRDLTENFRNWRANLMIEVIDRGIAIVHQRDYSGIISDPWHIDESERVRQNILRTKQKNPNQLTMTERIEIEKKFSTYKFTLQFPPLPQDLEAEYEDLKRESRVIDTVKPERISEIHLRIRRRAKMACFALAKVVGRNNTAKLLDVDSDSLTNFMNDLLEEDLRNIKRRLMIYVPEYIKPKGYNAKRLLQPISLEIPIRPHALTEKGDKYAT